MIWQHSKRALMSVAVVVVLGGIAVVIASHAFRMENELEWNTWVQKVRIASQPGASIDDVTRLLGSGFTTEHPSGSLGRGLQPKAVIPPGCKKVLVFGRTFIAQGCWAAYVFVDARGRVVGASLAGS